MCKYKCAVLVLLGLALCRTALAAPWQSLGRPATPAEIARWNIDVRPDGMGLPQGQGSVAQGQEIYDSQCASCHGSFGESNEYMALSGGIGSLASASPQRTVGSRLNYATTLWDYINRAMPFQYSKSLTADQVYAVTAYVLHLNDIVTADAVLDPESLARIEMPNRDGFTTAHGFSSLDGKADVENTACLEACETQVALTSELPPEFTAQIYGDIREHFRGLASMNHERSEPLVVTTKGTNSDVTTLLNANGCMACHGIDNAGVGPAFNEVAARYAGDKAAAELLKLKLKQGGAGSWGSVSMPPQSRITDADAATIVDWIVSGMEEN